MSIAIMQESNYGREVCQRKKSLRRKMTVEQIKREGRARNEQISNISE
jgi:hypothetical protein